MIRARNTRRALAFVLALLLVLVQQAGFAHALTHVGNPASQNSSRTDSPHPATKVCTECVAFATLDSAAVPAPAHSPIIVPAATPVASTFRHFTPEFVTHFRSRAPPRNA